MPSYLGVWSLGLFSPTFFSTSSKKKFFLRHIWQHRNSVVYNDKQPDTLCIFKAKIKQKVKTEFQIAKVSGKLSTRLDAS